MGIATRPSNIELCKNSNLIIAGLNYNIELEKNLDRDASALGTHSGNSATIKIDYDLRECVKKKVLLHEILEAINFEYELKLEHNVLCIFESALFEIINNKENEWLLDYLKNNYDRMIEEAKNKL